MGGQVLGGGVIVLVCVLLWLVYLLPSWANRHRYDAAERNAVRLNQALRILAETSETPEEVRLELNARTAFAQQRLAKRAQAERDAEARRAQEEREAFARRSQAEQAELERRAQREREQARIEEARALLQAARALPAARRSHARRRARILAAVIGLLAFAVLGWGAWTVVQTGTQYLLWGGVAAVVGWLLVVRRIARVGRRTAVPAASAEAPERVAGDLQDVVLPGDRRAWAPRSLPRPLTVSTGSQASAVLDAAAAREALRQAAMEEAMRERADAQRPPSIAAARQAREETAALSGAVGDAEIEAHVRRLLARRAVGQ